MGYTMLRYQYVYLIFIRTLKQITAGIISKIRKLKANNIEQSAREMEWGVAGSRRQVAIRKYSSRTSERESENDSERDGEYMCERAQRKVLM